MNKCKGLCCCCCGNKKDEYQVQRYDENGKLKTSYFSSAHSIKDVEHTQSIVRIKRSQYQELMKKYKGNKKFTDGQFPPGAQSLGQLEGIPSDCQWGRISQILQSPKLFEDGVEPTDVVHGSLGDCYFLSAVSAIAQDERRIYNIFGEQQYNPNGVYKVGLRVDGIVQEVIIDDYVPINKGGRPLFCQPNSDEFWVVLLEKAWAKVNGSYANIVKGTPTDVFKAVTYAPSELKPIKNSLESQDKIWRQIHENVRRKNPCCASTIRDQSFNLSAMGLDPGHGYSLINAVELQSNDGRIQRMIKLRNPWGRNEWKGQGSEHDTAFWSRIQASSEKDQFLEGMVKSDDGIFLMRFQDFCENFNQVNFCYLAEHPTYEIQKLNCDKKHGTLYELKITHDDTYTIQLHQSVPQRSRLGDPDLILNRSTLLLVRQQDYEFIQGSLKYQEEDNIVRAFLRPGKFWIYAKVDPTHKGGKVPEDMSVSCYSNSIVDIKPLKKSHQAFFNNIFLSHARHNKRRLLNEDKMWIAWKLLFEKGGYAYLAFGVDRSSDKKFIITFNEQDFLELGYSLKKPFKGKGKQTIEVKPGHETAIVARVRNGELKTVKFPPPFDIEMDKA